MFTNVYRSHFVTLKAKFRWKVTEESFAGGSEPSGLREAAAGSLPERKTSGTRALCPVASCHVGVRTDRGGGGGGGWPEEPRKRVPGHGFQRGLALCESEIMENRF
jgi:hypothetical protein